MALGISGLMPTLAVTDLERAREFYGGVLELEELETPMGEEEGIVYRIGDQVLFLYARAQPSGSTATACSFWTDDVEKLVDALRRNGLQFEEYDIPEMGLKTRNGIADLGDGLKSAWFRDPSGNILAVGNSQMLGRERGRVPSATLQQPEARH